MIFADRLQDMLHFGGGALQDSVTDRWHDNKTWGFGITWELL